MLQNEGLDERTQISQDRLCFQGLLWDAALGAGMSKVIPPVVLGSRSRLGSDRLARTGLAVADADVPSVPCLVLHPALPALPALSETCARHSQDLSMAPNSCFPSLTPPKSAALLLVAEGLNSCKTAENPHFNAGDTPQTTASLAKSLCYFCIRQEYPQGGRRRRREGASCKWESPGLVHRAEGRGSGSGFLMFTTHSASALGDKQPHVMLSHASNQNLCYI